MPKHIRGVADSTSLVGTAHDDYMVGTTGQDVIDGRGGTDFIIGAKGDDTLTGGGGSEDEFAFNVGDGHDLVTDFAIAPAGAVNSSYDHLLFAYGAFANGLNKLQVDGYVWDGWSMTTNQGHVLTVTQQGADTVLAWDTGDTVRLAGMDVNAFHTGMLYLYPSDTLFS
jgi:hypothetical protein